MSQLHILSSIALAKQQEIAYLQHQLRFTFPDNISPLHTNPYFLRSSAPMTNKDQEAELLATRFWGVPTFCVDLVFIKSAM